MNRIPRQYALCALGAALAVSLAACNSSTANDSVNWQVVWTDEFDGPAGQSPDAANWGYDIGTDWGNGQLEYDTNRPENVSLDGNGFLAITARKEPWQGQNYTSARITTAGKFEPTYGRYEARIRLPRGQGLWPAFWLLGANNATVTWPACGEIDIMEFRGQEPSTVLGTVHGPGYSGGGGITRRFDILQDRFDTGFHIFSVEWGTDYITWSVDGMPYHSVRAADLPGPWVFDHPFYIILNVAVGGGFVGAPGPNTTFPQTMLVDWVRVYQQAP